MDSFFMLAIKGFLRIVGNYFHDFLVGGFKLYLNHAAAPLSFIFPSTSLKLAWLGIGQNKTHEHSWV